MNGFLNTSNILNIDAQKDSFADNPIDIGDEISPYVLKLETFNVGNNTLIMGRMVLEAGTLGADVVLSIYANNTSEEPIDVIEMPINSNSMESIDIFSYSKTRFYTCKKQTFVISIHKMSAGSEVTFRGYTMSFIKFHT